MNIYYISLGSFCHPKIIVRETNREYLESLPFDFNSSPHLTGITKILKILYETGTYDINLKEIISIHNEDELAVSEENMYLVHFFKLKDLKNNIDKIPCSIDIIKDEVINEVKNKFKKRFERLYKILNDTNNILCFMRIENYDNYGWSEELKEFTYVLSKFKNPNKYLIYSQKLIYNELHFNNTNVLNYDYSLPILFYKYYFYDIEIINNKQLFINLLVLFENLINGDNIINIKNNNFIEKYHINKDKYEIYKLTNIKYFSKYFMENNIIYINNVINGYEIYVKNEKNVFEKKTLPAYPIIES
jgi:hypothetical protein